MTITHRVNQTGLMSRTEVAVRPAAAVLAGQRLELLDRARVYACGITPYDVTHLGHAATFVWFDALGRTLRFLGVEPEVCRNVTDVDDVLDVAARHAGVAYDEFAAIQQFQFDRDMAALGARSPEHEPRAHRYVEQVIRLASGLLDAGAAYPRAGSVYFRGQGVASRAGLDRAEALRLSEEFGGRPGDPAKDDPLDMAIWQAREPGHPAWDSPWGPGRPGWHAECAAMAMSVFGPAVDVHAGGAELRFPHHAYHAAMAETFTGVRPYARAWFHAGVVTINGAKMAKSTGNLVLLSDLLAGHTAGAVRMMILDRPWGQGWDYRPALLETAAARLDTLYQAAARNAPNDPAAVDALRRLLAEDLNIPAALDLAIEAGGTAARTLVSVLGLS
jgi:cysteinyl-tRNA synthetase